MTQYNINTSQQIYSAHSVLVGTPLIVIMAFCFSFVLVQSAAHRSLSAISHSGAPTTAIGGTAQHQAVPARQQPTMAVGSASSSSIGQTPASSSIYASQPTNSSAAASLQTAVPNQQPDSFANPIKNLPVGLPDIGNAIKAAQTLSPAL